MNSDERVFSQVLRECAKLGLNTEPCTCSSAELHARPSFNVLRQGFTKLLRKLTPYPRLALSVWPSCLSLLNNWDYRAVPQSVSFLLFCVEIISLQAKEEPWFRACWANALPLSYIFTLVMNFGFYFLCILSEPTLLKLWLLWLEFMISFHNFLREPHGLSWMLKYDKLTIMVSQVDINIKIYQVVCLKYVQLIAC